jgi:hypothetical protein
LKFQDIIWHVPKLFDRLKCGSEVKTTEEQGIRARSLARNTSRVEGMLELQDGTKKNDKPIITHMDLHKPNSKLVSA